MIKTSFIGGRELTQALAKETIKIQELAGQTVLVGFPEDTGNYDDDQISIVEVAAKNEFGIGNPKRPFLRLGVDAAEDDLIEYSIDAASMVMDNKIDVNGALDGIGEIAKSSVQQYITDLKSPPNSKATIKRKGSSNPLIDTGEMKGAVTFITEGGEPTEGL